MGSKLLSTDLLVSIWLNPMMKAYQYSDYRKAANMLYSFNQLFKSFKIGIEDLPKPNDPDITDVTSRRNPTTYYLTYFEKYAPLLSAVVGHYQAMILEQIKDERGND